MIMSRIPVELRVPLGNLLLMAALGLIRNGLMQQFDHLTEEAAAASTRLEELRARGDALILSYPLDEAEPSTADVEEQTAP